MSTESHFCPCQNAKFVLRETRDLVRCKVTPIINFGRMVMVANVQLYLGVQVTVCRSVSQKNTCYLEKNITSPEEKFPSL